MGYYRALDELEKLAAKKSKISEKSVQTLHALVMGGRRGKAKPTPYRGGQNVIRDTRSGAIVYLPPEAKDVSLLMADLMENGLRKLRSLAVRFEQRLRTISLLRFIPITTAMEELLDCLPR